MTTTPPTRVVRDLTGLLNHAGHSLETRLAAALAEVDLTPRMQCVLIHALQEPRTQAQLAELAYLDKTTMVATVDALEALGFARREASPTDRRARIIAVTESGAEAARLGQSIVDRVHGDVLAVLPEAERGPFAEALERLVAGYLAEPVDGPTQVRRARQRA